MIGKKNSEYFEHNLSTNEMREVFSDSFRIKTWLAAEVALARAQVKVGLLPPLAAEEINKIAKIENIDFIKLRQDYEKIGFPIVPLLDQIKAIGGSEVAKWLHWGATSQDMIDTGLILQVREGLTLIESDMKSLMQILSGLVQKHRTSIMPGRTFGQYAVPITFGFKVAIWLDEILRHHERLIELKKRVLVGQCFGAVGTGASFKNHGIEINELMMKELNLGSAKISWHVSRDRLAEVIFWLTFVTSILEKIANEISTLMRTEINELREGVQQDRGISSTMPQKRNPIMCPWIIAISNKMKSLPGTVLSTMSQEHERGVSEMPLEWIVVEEAFLLTSGSLSLSLNLLKNLEVDEVQMRQNLELDGGFIMSEKVMMALAEFVGITEAKKTLSVIVKKSKENGNTFNEEVFCSEELSKYFSDKEIKEFLVVDRYTGSVEVMIDEVLEKYSKMMKSNDE